MQALTDLEPSTTTEPGDPGADQDRPVFRVVGIGASAGGLESLQRFFDRMPADSGMAFVVVQHLSPDFKSVMDELLSRHSDMPVTLAVDGEPLEPNHVYLLPPGKEIHVREGKLWLRDREPTAFALPIDAFFRSLADDLGDAAIAIVLSGSGSDGSRGVVEVKRAGGLVLAESPATARFDSMPTSSVATGAVDRVCAPEEMPQLLCGLRAAPESSEQEIAGTPSEPKDALFDLLREQYGIDFARYKANTVSRRLARRLSLKGETDLHEYVNQLRDDPAELSTLYHDLLIGVTRFFRDPEAFQVLEERVIPDILERVPPQEEIRVWSAGCATGEEAYSMAILFHEALTRAKRPVNLKLLATDMHRASLERASSGIYTDDQLVHVSEERLMRYFTRRGGSHQVSGDLRQLVVFAPHNVMKDAPFTRMNLIACRNLLIYLDAEAQRSVISLFHFGLASGGILFLGSSETAGGLSHEFSVIHERAKLFRKRRDVRLLKPVPLSPGGQIVPTRPTDGVSSPRGVGIEPRLLASYDQLLDRFLPPSFLVDEQGRLLDSFGGAERFLSIKRRRPSGNLLDLVDGNLRAVLATAMQRVVRTGQAVSLLGLRLTEEETPHRVVVELVNPPRDEGVHLLVRIEEDAVGRPAARDVSAPLVDQLDPNAASVERVQSLEGELSYAKEVLQATVEELETSNEELQATNEELIASNEELQSTNEELQSTNEELYSVNAEYQQKIEELQQLNADIQHLLEGTDVGTIFLDSGLRIRKYTSRIANVFRVQEQDIGRELGDFSHTIKRPSLMDDLRRVLNEGISVEDEVRDEAGTPFFLRILPYRSGPVDRDVGVAANRSITGVVLTITDTTALERAREHLARLSAIVESSDDAIVGKDLDGIVLTWNRGAERLYGYTAEEAIGRDIRFLSPPGNSSEIDGFLAAIRRGERVEHVNTERLCKDGTRIQVSITLSPILDASGTIVGASAIARDVTPVLRAEREVRAQKEQIELLLASTAEAICGVDTDGHLTFSNAACARLLGYDSTESLLGHRLHELVHNIRLDGTPLSSEESEMEAAIRAGRPTHSSDETFVRADGRRFPVEYWSHPVSREGKVVGAVVTFLDITERRRALTELEENSRRREQFLAMLSHELRNPLAAILNAAGVVRSRHAGPTGLEHAGAVLERQGSHMARLLDDLLDVSRFANGKFELRKEPTCFAEAIDAAVESVQSRYADAGVLLEQRIQGRPLSVHGDPARLQQVVTNLLSNAVRHSARGQRVTLTADVEGGHVVVRVRDEGEGIEPERLPQVFDLFVQFGQQLHRANGGLGVGLTLVRSIVELHGGQVEAASEGVGKGCLFTVRIPKGEGCVEHAGGPGAETSKPRRIVVVEDQSDTREMLRILLEGQGHTVEEAGDGSAGIQVIAREKPDVALVDLGLPTLSGFEVARQIRQRQELAGVFLIALSGYGSESDILEAREAGFDTHLTKPTDTNRLYRLIERLRSE
jgi:two-component system CheB/CheR fusion protein